MIGRRFKIQRDEDVNGASGTGIVVVGWEVLVGDQLMCVAVWQSPMPSVVLWPGGVDHMWRIHSHGGNDSHARIIWEDE